MTDTEGMVYRSNKSMKHTSRFIGIITGLILVVLVIGFIYRTSNVGSPAADETRFTVYDNGTVMDSSTGLMWAAHDNGAAATWKEAMIYCEGYAGGGYEDWRMPTIEELKTLYDKDEPGYRPECAVYDWKVFLTARIHLSGGGVWTSEDHGLEAECLLFDYGCRTRMFKSINYIMRTLPLRNGPVN
jgi:hypothetical protein